MSIGLERDYRENDEVCHIMRKVTSIGFLPIPHVRNTFNNHLASPRTQRVMQNMPALDQWLTNLF